MKTIAYWAIHYGAEYLRWSVRSVAPVVDELHFLYTPDPSHGHASDLICPETEEQLKAEALAGAGDKPVFWYNGKGRWHNEGEQRSAIEPIAKRRDADLIVWVDADEIWWTPTLKVSIDLARENKARETRVRFVHFWRSMRWVCEDPCMPVRFINLNFDKELWYLSPQDSPVLHFGYAQKPETIQYKQSIHGHKAEWKPGWFEKTFLPWTPGVEDVHPTCGRNGEGVAFWTPKPTSIFLQAMLDNVLGDHPYRHLELIR